MGRGGGLGADTDTHFHTMFTQVYHKWQWYHVWFLRYGAQQTGFFVILDLFTLLPHNLKNQNFKQMKKHLEILSFYTVNHKGQSYDVWFLRYGAWQTEFFVIFDHVLSFYCPSLTNQKKNKSPGESILHRCTKNHDHMLQCSWDTCTMDVTFYFLFWVIFYLFIP